MRPIGKFSFVVDPNGNVVMVYDTGAHVCVMGSEHAHLLTNRKSPPPGLKLYGAEQAPLACIETGTMTLSLGALEGVSGMMSRRLVQHVRLAHFRVGMVSASRDALPPARGVSDAAQVRRGSRPAARNRASDTRPPTAVQRH